MWDIEDVGCFEILGLLDVGMLDVRYVGCSGCEKKNSCNNIWKNYKKNIHFRVLNSSSFADHLSVRKTTNLKRYMSVLDVQKKAYLRNFGHVQRCVYSFFLDQRYTCYSMKDDKYIKALSDQETHCYYFCFHLDFSLIY